MPLAALIFQLSEFSNTIDEKNYFLAEFMLNFFFLNIRVFDRVMKETGGDCLGIHTEAGEILGGLKNMGEIGITRGSHLAFVGNLGEAISASDELLALCRRRPFGHQFEYFFDIFHT